jgi:hypothetical protein
MIFPSLIGGALNGGGRYRDHHQWGGHRGGYDPYGYDPYGRGQPCYRGGYQQNFGRQSNPLGMVMRMFGGRF